MQIKAALSQGRELKEEGETFVHLLIIEDDPSRSAVQLSTTAARAPMPKAAELGAPRDAYNLGTNIPI